MFVAYCGVQGDVFRVVSRRKPKWTNFVEYRKYKLVYRKYASLYFVYGVDVNDNELMLFEAIHLFVELLDRYFEKVCELDLVENFYSVSGMVVCVGHVFDVLKLCMCLHIGVCGVLCL